MRIGRSDRFGRLPGFHASAIGFILTFGNVGGEETVRKVSMFFVIAVVMAFVPSSVETVHASDSVGKTDLEDSRTKEVRHVQLKSFMAPAYMVGKRRMHQRPITVVMEIPSYNRVHDICRQAPRIQAKLTETLYAYPVPIGKDKTIDDDSLRKNLAPRLVRAANRAIQSKNAITDIFVIDGAKSLGGGTISRLPFSSVLGCKELSGTPGDSAGH